MFQRKVLLLWLACASMTLTTQAFVARSSVMSSIKSSPSKFMSGDGEPVNTAPKVDKGVVVGGAEEQISRILYLEAAALLEKLLKLCGEVKQRIANLEATLKESRWYLSDPKIRDDVKEEILSIRLKVAVMEALINVVDAKLTIAVAMKRKPAVEPAPNKSSTNSSSTDPSTLSKCTVSVLKEMLRQRGLKVSGTKADLIDRLMQG